jgi:hypothetical protein
VFGLRVQLPDEVIDVGMSRVHGAEVVVFIWAKRENRLSRITTKIDTRPYNTVRRLKNPHTTQGKARLWVICGQAFSEIRWTESLTAEEKAYPLFHRIDDILMCSLIDNQRAPKRGERT